MADRPELAGVWGRHIYTFMFGVLAERERIDGSFLAQRPERWADACLYAYALRNLLRACWTAQAIDAPGIHTYGGAPVLIGGSLSGLFDSDPGILSEESP